MMDLKKYIFRPEPCISYTQTVYGLTRAAEFNHSGSSSPQNTMVLVFKLFMYTWSSQNV